MHACMPHLIYLFTDTHTHFSRFPANPKTRLFLSSVALCTIWVIQWRDYWWKELIRNPSCGWDTVACSTEWQTWKHRYVKIILHTTFTYPTTQQRPVHVVNNLFTLPSDSTDSLKKLNNQINAALVNIRDFSKTLRKSYQAQMFEQ